MPLYPIVPLLFILGEFGVLVGALAPVKSRTAALFGLGWIMLAGLLYFACFRVTKSASLSRAGGE